MSQHSCLCPRIAWLPAGQVTSFFSPHLLKLISWRRFASEISLQVSIPFYKNSSRARRCIHVQVFSGGAALSLFNTFSLISGSIHLTSRVQAVLYNRGPLGLCQVSPSSFAWAGRWLSSNWFAAIIILSFVGLGPFPLEEATSHGAVFLKVPPVEPWRFLRPKNYLHNTTKTSLPFSLLLTFALKVAGNAGLPGRSGMKQHLSVNASISLKLLSLM